MIAVQAKSNLIYSLHLIALQSNILKQSHQQKPTTHRKADPRYNSFYLVTTNKMSKIGPTHQELISYLVYPCAVGAYYN